MNETSLNNVSSESNAEGTPRNKVWIKPVDQIDVWLDSEGFYRKHNAKDGTCLFRAVAEQLFLTQAVHHDVRKFVTEYELRHTDFFQKMVTCPLIEYVEKIKNPWEWGGKVEIEAMAQMYKHDFIIYQEIGKPPKTVTNHGHDKTITLCFTQDKHYDSVFTKDHINTAAFCQSLVYEVLYKKVFELKEVDYAVKKMLHDKTSRFQKGHISLMSSGFGLRLEMRESCLNVKDLLDFGIIPFPYKVAKSLDIEVYRNVEYDTWNEYRKGLRYGFYAWNCRELQIGVKCQVKINENVYHGHIQEMQPNKGPVIVFIEEMGEKLSVPYESLELLPSSSSSSQPSVTIRTVFPFKLNPLQLTELKTEEKWEKNRRLLKSLSLRPKLKRNSGFRAENEGNYKDTGTDLESNEEVPVVSSSTEYYDQENDFHPGNEENSYPQNYMPHNGNNNEEQMCPDSTKPDGVPLIIPTVEPYRYHSYPAAGHPVPPMTLPLNEVNTNSYPCSPVAVNLMASKSMNVDGSDLPHSDVATLRFFYNLGLDHLRMNCFLRPGPLYYLNSNGTSQGYVPADSMQSQHIESNSTQPPVQGIKKNIFYEGLPLVQQCEGSNANNIGVGVPVSPVYYQTVECEPYFMTMPYVDYNTYDYSPVYTPTQNFPPSSYITPEGVVYQHIIPPAMVPTSLPI